jgi:hypothetical protein
VTKEKLGQYAETVSDMAKKISRRLGF